MTKEIERKWLPGCHFSVDSLKQHASKVEYIEQRYFQEYNDDKAVARVRQTYSISYNDRGNRVMTLQKSEITTKCGMGIERGEHNVPIDHELASSIMVTHMDQITIQKTRYTIPFVDQGVDIEVDVYEDLNSSLIHIEVEFPDREAADAFEPIHWFGEEVTDDKRHTNSALQNHPYQFWKENK